MLPDICIGSYGFNVLTLVLASSLVWHIFHPFWHQVSGIVYLVSTSFPASYLANKLVFYLAQLLALELAYLLASFLAYYTFWHTSFLFLAFYLTYLVAFQLPAGIPSDIFPGILSGKSSGMYSDDILSGISPLLLPMACRFALYSKFPLLNENTQPKLL